MLFEVTTEPGFVTLDLSGREAKFYGGILCAEPGLLKLTQQTLEHDASKGGIAEKLVAFCEGGIGAIEGCALDAD